ncbi:VTI1A [Symbiodinium natans]|uniref:VTI1A protein n=1 Tax=Symbiodinium natans TaxID=878477 RepID=A0A812QW65_9DINO|nr:VTI1A [Symbiodinium natans]
MPSASEAPSIAAAVSFGAILDVKDKHSLYVSNLSVTVTEDSLREIFRHCGPLDQVIFRTYPGSLKWYAQLNFQTADGVVEASKMEGTPICGTGIRCSAIDPTAYAANDVLARLQAKEEAANKEDPEAARQEWYKQLREHAEARIQRTVHVAGLPESTTLQELQRLGEQFGAVEQLRLDRDAKSTPFGLVQFKELGIARGCCLKRTFLVDEHVVVFSESKSEVNSTDIEEATVEFRHPCVDRALANAGTEPKTQPQGKFWEELAEKQRQLYNRKLEKVRATAEAILGPGMAPSPPPSPPEEEEEDFFAWAKQAAAYFNPEAEEQGADAEKPLEEQAPPAEEPGPVDLEEHPDIVPGTELAVLQDSSSEEISESSEASGIEQVGGQFADGPRAQRKRRAALQKVRRRPKPKALAASLPITPAQWAAAAAAARAQSAEKLKSPAEWAAARARALERLKAKSAPGNGSRPRRRRSVGDEVQDLVETLEAEEGLKAKSAPGNGSRPRRRRSAGDEVQVLVETLEAEVKSTGASYALWSHGKLAQAAGLPSEVIDALQRGEDLQQVNKCLQREEQAALALCDDLLRPGMMVSEETYAAAVAQLGERRTFEVSATVGFYLLLSAVLKTFDVRPPESKL